MVITHIQADEIDKAISTIESLSSSTVEVAKDEILLEIIKKVEKYRNGNTWLITNYDIVKPVAIEELKKYKSLLDLLPLENTTTNIVDFIDNALELESCIEWNEYYKYVSNDNYMEDMIYWIQQGMDYSSWDLAQYCYQKAYTAANNGYLIYKDNKGKGMDIVTGYFATWVSALNEWRFQNFIDRDTSYDEAYNTTLEDYGKVIDSIDEFINSIPSKLY